MEDSQMIDIKQRLTSIFEKQRLVFWYDDNAELKEQFDNISLDSVEKLVIDNNEFSIKRQLLKLQPDDKFLIYSPTHAPKNEANWLLDLNIANYMFSADKTSLILQNLGLDVTFKEFVGRFDKFLNAPTRVEALKTTLSERETQDSLGLKMMAVSIGCDDNIASIMLRVFENEKHFETLSKFALDGLFFKAVKSKFAYEGESLKDLLHKLLQNHFYFYLDKSKCTLNSDARLFVKSWMDSSRHKESFERISKTVENELNIKNIIADADASKLMMCDTYEKCDQAVISHLLTKLNSDNISSKEMSKSIAIREHTFWYENYQNIYQAILSASELFDFVKETRLSMSSFNDGIKEYTLHWHKADRYYREYSLASSKAEHLELLKALNVKIEDVYLNGYLRELNDNWQSFADTYTAQTTTSHQQHFYSNVVEAHLKKNQKVFVIISDAMRYECGVELSSKIESMDKYSSSCESMVSSLPSYTQLGMASLLPHKELSIGDKNDIVFIDGKSSSGMANRDKILKSYEENASAIGYEEFLKFSKNNGREFVKNSSVIYIYHDEIDKMGEKNEIKTFDAVVSTFDSLIKVVKQISNFNGSTIYITSDHGFLYTNRATEESEFCKAEAEGAIKLNRRFIIGQGLSKQTCVAKYDGKSLGIEGENDFLIAKSINKIRVQGGGNRFVHGGATLQELVIPLISVKKARSTDVKDVNVEIIPLRNISTNTVNVALYQSEIVDEKTQPITLKISFESVDGVTLSDEFKHTFDSTEQYDTNRESRFRLTFKQDINKYNNQTIKLVTKKVLDGSSETPIYKELEVKLALSFFNDFDDDF
ncbi:BREX-1 system phosphatase PglZ type A [Sulfurimonas xiamenensis]|uniref:BREX-1 system phosphatase PglZ type A n=1 Tax=Sulfurimonas xiamenensis TaxID=2590021 RepID=A0AAJ4A4K4_9BACT|nr:BREX-1 system phosphatase PglZ type A [Sulfurimonas xiamenensis]QFR43758.1 BREX-1 system phosphatase PglZ type A [Sulfurimonas xiamenensis]